MDKTDIKSLEYSDLRDFVKELEEPAFRADQIFDWLHKKLVNSFDEMTNLSKRSIEKLSECAEIKNAKIKNVEVSKDGNRKYLFEMNDGALIESVMLKYKYGISVCVSSQVGCDMGCRFCASTIKGCLRNLAASEMLSQVYEIQKDAGERVSHVVIMGMGEPMLNFGNVSAFIRLLTNENALHISRRNITISTCGIVPGIRRMADESLGVTLALSLHAPNNEIRQKIMPVSKKYSLEETLEACGYYFEKTGRRVTFEYCLLKGVNDSKENALELSELLKGTGSHVNLIPFNPVDESEFKESTEQDIKVFQNILENANIGVTRRREIGRDINGACGQLVRRES